MYLSVKLDLKCIHKNNPSLNQIHIGQRGRVREMDTHLQKNQSNEWGLMETQQLV